MSRSDRNRTVSTCWNIVLGLWPLQLDVQVCRQGVRYRDEVVWKDHHLCKREVFWKLSRDESMVKMRARSTCLSKQLLFDRKILQMDFLRLAPLFGSEHFVAGLQSLHIGPNFHNRTRCRHQAPVDA